MWTISKGRNRKGFTLIELMIVIAIIIILAAIAIPNYLKMTERAKKARIAQDMSSLATALETFRTDWGSYPTVANAGTPEAVDNDSTEIYAELGGIGTGASINVSGSTNAVGENGPIEYLKPATLKSIVDPFTAPSKPSYMDGHIYYLSNTDGSHWVTFAYIRKDGSTPVFLYRTDAVSSVTEISGNPPLTIGDDGTVGTTTAGG